MSMQVTTTVYTLAELMERGDAAAVDAARQWVREVATDYDWYDSVYEYWQSALAQIGFPDAEIAFTGFWSQGDGASFTCTAVDLDKLTAFLAAGVAPGGVAFDGKTEDFRPWIVEKIGGKRTADYRRLVAGVDYVDCSVARDRRVGNYVHENTCTFVADQYRRRAPRFDALLAEFAEDGEQLRRDLCRAIYADLESEYNDLTSDENVDELADANGWTFDAAGRRFG